MIFLSDKIFIVILFSNIQNSPVGKGHRFGIEIDTFDCRRASKISHLAEFE